MVLASCEMTFGSALGATLVFIAEISVADYAEVD